MKEEPDNLRQQLLDEAAQCVNIDRRQNYGSPERNFERIAAKWSVTLGIEVTPVQVALCMIDVKTCRLIETPNHWDSWVDIAGYGACGGEVGKST